MINIGLANDRAPAVPVEFRSPSELLVNLLNQGFQLGNGFPLFQRERDKFSDRCAKGLGIFKLDVIGRQWFRVESRADRIFQLFVNRLLGKFIAGFFRDPLYLDQSPLSQIMQMRRVPFTQKTLVGSSVSYPM